ncbi:MAG TPA: carbohydrate kinase [Bacteroidetes bacterium]|nr:carbohydrate kinase [Bacteroidota bacterium]HRR07713.1 PfkB family carbohydrate kinase [Rhodothermales bacterium]
MNNHMTIVGLGEVLWDVFPDGIRPGGAPANVAFHAQQLGNRGIITSRVGSDERGTALTEWLAGKGLNTSYIQTDTTHPTGTVAIHFIGEEPYYTITSDVAWDYLAFTTEWQTLAQNTDAVCFATLAQRTPDSAHTIRRFLSEMPTKSLRVMDINMRPPFFGKEVLEISFPLTDVVKLNVDEKAAICRLFDLEDPYAWLFREFDIRWICQTHGKDGAELISPQERWRVRGETVDATQGDAVGVGDAFLAALTTALLRKDTPETALQFANRYAAKVVTFKGAMPVFDP